MTTRQVTNTWHFETRTALLATATALGDVNLYTPPAVTVKFPGNLGDGTVSGYVDLFFYIADATAARRIDGFRIGMRVDGGAWQPYSRTGTGITNTGDQYSVRYMVDFTSFLGTNCTGASHSIEVRAEIETDVASNVNNIFAVLTTTHRYDDVTATQWNRTVLIPIEGETSFLSTTANYNMRGSTGAAQIPALDTWLPEANKVYDQIAVHFFATDADTSAADFNLNVSISGGTTHVCSTLEKVLNSSCHFEYSWVVPSGYFDTSIARDLQAWSSLASRFQRLHAIVYVTYSFDKPVSGQVMNSVQLLLSPTGRFIGANTSNDDWPFADIDILEPSPSIRQSAVQLFYTSPGATTLRVVADVGSPGTPTAQGTTAATYTNTALVGSGDMPVCHRLDVAHGGSALTASRGRNRFRINLLANTANAISGCSGQVILNYVSDIDPTYGAAAHNKTISCNIVGSDLLGIAGSNRVEINSTAYGGLFPDPSETFFYINSYGYVLNYNASSVNQATHLAIRNTNIAPADGQEFQEAGWSTVGWHAPISDGEFGTHTAFFNATNLMIRKYQYSNLRMGISPFFNHRLLLEIYTTAQPSMILRMTYHHLRFDVTGTITDPTSLSTVSTVTVVNHGLNGQREVDGFGSITGGGSYTFRTTDDLYDRTVIVNEGAAERHGGSSFGLPTNP